MRGRGQDRRGRSVSGPPFIRLFKYVYESAAYRSLTPAERVVLLAVMARYNGGNNGSLALSVRDASEECRVNKDTASKAFQVLEIRGFLENTRKGAFSVKMRLASEWRLTWERCDKTHALPSKAFLKWRPTERPDLKAISGAGRKEKIGHLKSDTEAA